MECLNYITSGPGNENRATKLLLAMNSYAEGQVRFFSCFLMSGLVPPFSDFFLQMMAEYGLLVLQLHPNVVSVMAVFAHLCENFVGVYPSIPLFCHFYVPKIDNKNRSGSVTWRFRNSMAGEYIGGNFISRWPEWRSDWCWIKMENPPACCEVPQGPAMHMAEWKDKGP